MDLDSAPKLILLFHVLTEILPQDKRLSLGENVNINKTDYFPKPYLGVDQKNLCEFLLEYSKFC
jgi:hypothetical protein